MKLTKEQAAIIGAFTGFAAGPFSDVHEYAENVMGRPVWTYEFGNKEFSIRLSEAAKSDFISIAHQA